MESLTAALRETLAVFDGEPWTPLTTTEVADRLDLGRRSTYDRLSRLVDQGYLETKAAGASARVWWQPPASHGEPTMRNADDSATRREESRYLESIFENQRDVIFVFDVDASLRRWNDRVNEVTGYTDDELAGKPGVEFIGTSKQEWTAEVIERILSGERVTVELPLEMADGERFSYEFSATPIRDADGAITGFTVIGRDVSERKDRLQQFERQRTEAERELDEVFERVNEAFVAVDDGWRVQYVNDYAEDLLQFPTADVLGMHLRNAVTEIQATAPREQLRTAMSTQTSVEFEFYAGGLDSWVEVRAYPSESGLSIYFRDVSDRITRERQLRERIRQQEVVTALGQAALEGRDLDALLRDAAAQVADALDTDYCKVLDLDSEADELLLRQGVGWHDGIVGSATVSAVDDDSQAAYTLEAASPVVVEDLSSETRFGGPALLTDHDVRSGISTIIGPVDDPWGILGTHDTAKRTFSDHDVTFVQSVAHILASAIARHRGEMRLRRQREQATALLDVTEVVQGVTDAVIEQSTRQEIETAVCERLAASDSYLFAWIGDVDPASQTVQMRAEAGVEGYLDDITISIDPSDELSDGATGRAFRTGEMQTLRDLHTDPDYAPWRDRIADYGFRSSIAIPVTAEDAMYGVLNVYAARPNAFEEQEQAVLSRLSDVVGHAIMATERKRALLTDDVVELAFRTEDIFADAGIDPTVGGATTFDHAVPVTEDEFIVYGSASGDATAVVEALVDAVPYWVDVSFGPAAADERVSLELRTRNPPLLSTLLAVGGSIDHAVLGDDGSYDVTLHVPTNVEVQRVTDAIQEAYPSAEMLRRRQVARGETQSDVTIGSLAVDLTERQRNVLEAAYYAGYFDWPRTTTSADVAASLGISQPTFSQHLRRAEQQVLDALIENARLS